MKRFMFGAVIVLALLMTVSCNKETSPENRILGTWGLVQERVHYEDADPSDGIDVRPDEVYSYESYAFQYRFGDYGVLYYREYGEDDFYAVGTYSFDGTVLVMDGDVMDGDEYPIRFNGDNKFEVEYVEVEAYYGWVVVSTQYFERMD